MTAQTVLIFYAPLLLFIAVETFRPVIEVPGIMKIFQREQPKRAYFVELENLLTELLAKIKINRCYGIIHDRMHADVFSRELFEVKDPPARPQNYLIQVADEEDLLAPDYATVKVLQEIKRNDCDLILIIIWNGQRVGRFLRFVNEHRILNTKANYLLLHDHRLFVSPLLYIWKKIVSCVFIRLLERELMHPNRSVWFELVTVPYPNVLRNTFYAKILNQWKFGKLQKRNVLLFRDKTSDLQGSNLHAAMYEHLPMVVRSANMQSYKGVEYNILKSIQKCMNFTVDFYKPIDSGAERWGRKLSNGTYTGLVGEIVHRTADFAIGDLTMNDFNVKLMDFGRVHSMECMTFLTPESSTDNSWKTLIAPFCPEMWACVLSSQFLIGLVFFLFANIGRRIVRTAAPQKSRKLSPPTKHFRRPLHSYKRNEMALMTVNQLKRKKVQNYKHKTNTEPLKDVFDDYSNCVLLTYSMLLLVSLPNMPKLWSSRILAGWYWIYCLLIASTYRASFTAILANPPPRITIDSLEALEKSKITAGAWGVENQQLFLDSFDSIAQKIGTLLEQVDDIEGTTARISDGQFAYYDNEFFLRYLRSLKNGNGNAEDDSSNADALHIMKSCVHTMPKSIGMEKNSPLKPNVDKYIQRLMDAGLVAKWLNDVVEDLPAEEEAPQEALMDLKKFWSSFVVLAVGYCLSIIAFLYEKLHFKYVVEKSQLYDKLYPKRYYHFVRNSKLKSKKTKKATIKNLKVQNVKTNKKS